MKILIVDDEASIRELLHFNLPGRIEVVATGGKQDFGLEDESIADDADVFAV